MNTVEFETIKKYAQSQMPENDMQHALRTLGLAYEIAEHYDGNIKYDILTAACLLHDIDRQKQLKNISTCHAETGSVKAYNFLLENNWSEPDAAHVRDCISTHRNKDKTIPNTIEAKILYDADKIDTIGTVGIIRNAMYLNTADIPIYTIDDNNCVNPGNNPEEPSLLESYQRECRNLADTCFTQWGRKIAKERQEITDRFYFQLLTEVSAGINSCNTYLAKHITKP